MRNKRLARVVRAVERRFPGTKVVVERWESPDADVDVKWWLSILNCPARSLAEADDFATRLSMRLYGWKPAPWCVSSLSPRNTRKSYSDRIGAGSHPKSRSTARRRARSRRHRPHRASNRARA